MSEKPSLYVVEKKEVIILVVLFVLVTVLSFTLGVRYGESVGRKQLQLQQAADKEHEAAHPDSGGTLGKAETAPSGEGHGAAHGEGSGKPDHSGHPPEAAPPPAHSDGHDTGHPAPAAPAHGESHGGGGSGAPKTTEKPASPEVAASHGAAEGERPHEAVDKNSDEYLLSALKEAGVEAPGAKSPGGAKLPEQVKEPPKAASRAVSGSFVIQVGSHPTRAEAESQVKALKARQLSPEILPAVKDKHGEWHRVVVGSYRSKREAEKEASLLKAKGSVMSYFVWRLP